MYKEIVVDFTFNRPEAEETVVVFCNTCVEHAEASEHATKKYRIRERSPVVYRRTIHVSLNYGVVRQFRLPITVSVAAPHNVKDEFASKRKHAFSGAPRPKPIYRST